MGLKTPPAETDPLKRTRDVEPARSRGTGALGRGPPAQGVSQQAPGADGASLKGDAPPSDQHGAGAELQVGHAAVGDAGRSSSLLRRRPSTRRERDDTSGAGSADTAGHRYGAQLAMTGGRPAVASRRDLPSSAGSSHRRREVHRPPSRHGDEAGVHDGLDQEGPERRIEREHLPTAAPEHRGEDRPEKRRKKPSSDVGPATLPSGAGNHQRETERQADGIQRVEPRGPARSRS